MSRLDYDEPDDTRSFLMACAFQGNMDRAIAGKKGQAILRELEAALLALPEKRLLRGGFVSDEGDVCAIGCLALSRKLSAGKPRSEALEEVLQDLSLDEDEQHFEDGGDNLKRPVEVLKIVRPLAFAIMQQNDETGGASPEETYDIVLRWVRGSLKEEAR